MHLTYSFRGFGVARGLAVVLLCVLGATRPVRAVIVQGGHATDGTPDNSGRNLNPAPSNVGDYVGTFGLYTGTPIAPRYFITANHVGDGGTGGSFIFANGTASPTLYTATLAGAQNDLAIWKIADTDPAFSLYAPLYTGASEVGKSLVAIGRGTPRGDPVFAPSNPSQTVGWQWSSSPDTLISWGTGTVNDVTTVPTPGFGGDHLRWYFNFDAAKPDTGILSDGDSGGPMFVFNPTSSRYELAGINALVDQVSSQSEPNPANPQHLLRDALYDARGFYDGSTLIAGANPVPLGSYASRISSAMPFINATITPEPGVATLVLSLAGAAMIRRRGR